MPAKPEARVPPQAKLQPNVELEPLRTSLKAQIAEAIRGLPKRLPMLQGQGGTVNLCGGHTTVLPCLDLSCTFLGRSANLIRSISDDRAASAAVPCFVGMK